MKRGLLVVPLLAVGLLVWLRGADGETRTAARLGADAEEARRLRVASEAGARATEDQGETAEAPDAPPRIGTRGRLVYGDGTPARNITLQLAIGRPLEVRQWRNGDTPAKTLWLVTQHLWRRTDAEGAFDFPAVRAPHGARRVLFTEPDQHAFVLAEFEPHAAVVPAAKKVPVKGYIVGADGERLGGYELQAQTGEPEGWHTRTSREPAAFVTSEGDLMVDAYAKVDYVTAGDGSFDLALVPGPVTFSFGEGGRAGSRRYDLVPGRAHDLGEVRLPPRAPAGPAGPVRGKVLDLAGRGLAGAEIRLWAGNVGPPSHTTRTDEHGEFRFARVEGVQAIAWTVTTDKPHLVLPTQCSGSVPLPCSSPLQMHAPGPGEYCWARFDGVAGFFVFERDGLFLGGTTLDGTVPVGMPPGRYRIHVVTPKGRILRAVLAVAAAAEKVFPAGLFEDTN